MSEPAFDLLMALTEDRYAHGMGNTSCHQALMFRLQKNSRRAAISPEERLAVTFSFLASGTPYRRPAYSFRISPQTISVTVAETCAVIYDVLKDKYLAMPQTEREWKAIADGFWARWNIPNTLGAIDGKHVQIKKPTNPGSAYFNYKGSFSLVLMAMCDYRISRARRVIENVFGIMACKWRVLLKPIETSVATADAITKAICALHNFVIDEDKIHSPSAQADTGLANEDNSRWRREIDPLSSANVRARGGRATLDARNMRQDQLAFFNGPGAVEWQNEYI